ncbi:MAG: PD40 domain-containing protein [Acidobacteria bacterium]|nr:PD40 domain-containing protein [Acidobacteriota bacterium]
MADKCYYFQFDNVQVDLQSFKVSKDGTPVSLEPKAIEVLVFFINNQGRLIEKNELLDAIWNDSFVTPNALTRVIAQLRKGLGDDVKEARYIETVPTRGYRFIPDVRKLGAANEQAMTGHAELSSPSSEQTAAASTIPTGKITSTKFHLPIFPVAAGGVVVLIISFLTFLGLRMWPTSAKPRVLKTVQVTSSPLMDMYPAFSPDGQSLAYCAVRNGSFELFVRPLTLGSREVQVTSDGAQNMQPTWSPDGKQIAYHSRQRGGIWVIPALGGVARQIVDVGADPAWSPDGKWLVYQTEGPVDLNQTAFAAMPPSTLWVIPAQGGAPTQVTHVENPVGGHGAPAWSPDSKRIIFVTYMLGRSEIWSVTAEGKNLKQFSSGPINFYDPVYSPDGNYVFLTTGAGNFQVWRKRISPTGESVGEAEELANTGAALARYLTIAPDGKHLAYSSLMLSNNLGSVSISPESGKSISSPALLTQDTNRRKTSPVFSLDGKQIVYSQWRAGAGGELWIMNADGANPRQLTAGLAGLPNWMPDGKSIAVIAREAEMLKMWEIDVQTGKQRVMANQTFPIALGRVSPNGKSFAFNANTNGAVNIATLPIEGGPARQITFSRDLMGFPCWSPDGQWLAFQVKRGGSTDVAVIPSEGGTPEYLTNNEGQSWPGGWAADQDRIAFAGQRNGIWNVYWVSRRTKIQTQVTNYTKPNIYVRYPVWSPRGDQIVYEIGETTGNIWLLELN